MTHDCAICLRPLSANPEDRLVIHHMPMSTFRLQRETTTLSAVECPACGAAQLIDTPLSPDFLTVHRSINSSAQRRDMQKARISGFLEQHHLQGKGIVEVGCGDGQYLEVLRELGMKPAGVESSEEYLTRCREKGFPNVVDFDQAFLEEYHGKFDALVMFHVLEHFPNPRFAMALVYRLLAPGGVGLIEVPNYDHITEHRIWLEFTKDHRFYFRQRSLMCLALCCGFDVLSCSAYDGGLSLALVIRKPVPGPGLSNMTAAMEEAKRGFKKQVDELGGEFMIYGAGHYTQLLLNLVYAEYGVRPQHIFDSNPQKCGGDICGVAVRGKSEIVNVTDCRNVIVNCGVYNSEVRTMLESMVPSLNIIVLE